MDPSQELIQEKVRAEALRQGVPPELALAMTEVESNFKNIKAKRGESYGPLQVHVSSGYTAAQLWGDMDLSIRVGVGIIKQRLQKAGGDSLLSRILYFCGPGYLIPGQKGCSEVAVDRLKTRWGPVAAKWGVQAHYA